MKKNILAFFLSLGLHIAIISTLYGVSVNKEKKEVKTISLLHVSLETYKNELPKKEEVQKSEEIKPMEKIITKNEKTKPLNKIKPLEKKIIQEKEPLLAQNDTLISEKKMVVAEEAPTTPPQKQTAPQEPKIDYKNNYINENLILITQAIEKYKSYPLVARKNHVEGTVEVEFTLSQNCTTSHITAKKGHSLLQNAAISAIEKAQREFPCPNETITISIPMVYALK